jgi:AcrR family transcriptional regulator
VARPTVIDEGTILDVARDTFLELGFSVPTAEIAKRAGVSEGSIFKRFPTKAALFSAALKIPRVLPWKPMAQERFHRKDTQKALSEIGIAALEYLREQMPCMLKIHAHLSEIMHIHADERPPPLQAVDTMTEFFKQQANMGTIVTSHPEAIARMFMGSMVNYVFFEIMFEYHPTLPDEYVQQIVDTLWNGISPGGSQ